MHESRANEILKLAEAELAKLDSDDQVDAIIEISPLYVQCKNGEGLKLLLQSLKHPWIELSRMQKPLGNSLFLSIMQ